VTQLFISFETFITSAFSAYRLSNFFKDKLIVACKDGNIERVQSLLKRRINIDYDNQDGWTALTTATVFRHYDIVNLLLDCGADIDFQDTHKHGECTALMVASENGDIHMVHLLLDQDAWTDAKTWENERALFKATRKQHIDVVELLLKRGANVNVNQQMHDGYNSFLLAASLGHIDIVHLMLKHGANIHHQTSWSSNALFGAVAHGCNDMVALLLDHDVSNVGQRPAGIRTVERVQAVEGEVVVAVEVFAKDRLQSIYRILM
jgi:ankyrin repeat protein